MKKLVIFILLSVAVFLSLNYWTINIDKELDCIAYTLGEDVYDNVVVRLVGKMHKSLCLNDYVSYVLYIDGKRIPADNHLLAPYRVLGENKVTWHDRKLEKNFKLVSEIQSTYSKLDRNNALNIAYEYWLGKFGNTRKRHRLAFGVLFFSDEKFDDIIIGVNREPKGFGGIWTNHFGNKVIVSGHDLKSASKTFKVLNMPVFDEDGNAIVFSDSKHYH